MTRRLFVAVALVLSVLAAQAGGIGERTDRNIAVTPREAPPSVMDKKVYTPHGSTTEGLSPSLGTYTTLEGWWDYQSNGVNQSIRVDPSTGKIHVIYMLAEDSSAVSASRRTAYAVSANDGATWNNFSNVRVPNIRSGYPTIDLLRGSTAPGSPLIANHNLGGGTDNASFVYLGDTTGIFIVLNPMPLRVPPLPGGEPIWPFVVSGSNGNIIVHASGQNVVPPEVVLENSITWSTDFGGTWRDPWYVGPMSYSASGGRNPLTTNGVGRIGTVVTGDSGAYLYESTNNGLTWPTTPVQVYPARRYAGAETLGVWVGLDMIYYNGTEPIVALNTSRASATGFFFAGSRIEVWSPTLGYKTAVAWDSLTYPSTMVPQSNHLALGYPSMATSGSSIVMVFQAFLNDDATQDLLSGGRYFSDIFLTQSTDGGNTWAPPVNITNTPQMDERYPNISEWNPAGSAYLIWQEDTRAGTYAGSIPDLDEAPLSLSRQVFYKANLTTLFPLNDITARVITNPVPAQAIRQGVAFSPRATFRNVGLVAQSNVPVKFQILNSSQTIVYTNTQTITSLASGANTEVTFAAESGTLTPGLYRTRAIAANPGDVLAANDSVFNSLNVIPLIPVTGTYFENFEDTAPETGGFGWYSASYSPFGQSDWVRGTPAKVQIANAWSGTKCYVTKLTGNYSDDLESFLGTPAFDLSGVTGMARVEFYQNFVIEPLWDGGWLQYSTDGGTTWIVADHVLGTGPTFNTGKSTGWYNAAIDSQIVPGAPAPPMWGDSTVLYGGHVNRWIKSTTMVPVGGYSEVRFRFYFSADGAQNREGWAIDDFKLKVGSGTVSVPYALGWNMISNPVQKPAGQDSVLQLYPASAFNYVFGFGAGGYFQTKTMTNGPGYWGKFTTAGSANISGTTLQSLSAPVNAGWNMIGSMTTTVDTANVYPSPYGSRLSIYFKYNNGYFEAATLEPGKAYWVKAAAPGAFLYLPPAPGAPAPKASANPLAQLNTLTVKDAAGNGTTLYFGGVDEGQVDVSMYEMPPVPPQGAFDARFSAMGGETAEAGYMVQTHEKGALAGEFPIRMQSAVYPVTVSWNIVSDAGYRLTDGMGNRVFRAKELQGSGSMVVRNAAVNRLTIAIGGEALPTAYALLQNYPNPFNPSTTIKFALPEPSRVTVEIYNLLGQRVNTLMSEGLGAGYHEVKWNGTASSGQVVGSGVYFVRFSADGVEGGTFSDIRKVMLMK